MKKLKVITSGSTSIKLLNDSEELIGELLFNSISGFKEKIKIKEKFFRIKAVEFIGIDIRVFNEDDKLLIQTDASNDRLVYFGDSKEYYVYKSERWFKDKINLFVNNKLLMSITVKGFFRTKYEIIVADAFNNHLMILTFLNFYIRMKLSA